MAARTPRAPGDLPWQALPHILPRHELDHHKQDVYSVSEEVLRRIARLEHQVAGTGDHAAQLDHKSRYHLATKRALADAAGRFEESITGCRSELAHCREELQAFVRAEITATHRELEDNIARVREELAAAVQDVRQLEVATKDAAAFCTATYVSKVQHADSYCRLQGEWGAWCGQLQKNLDSLQADKASKSELRKSFTSMMSAHQALESLHEGTSKTLRDTVERIAKEERRTADGFADTSQRLDVLLDQLKQHATDTAASHEALRGVSDTHDTALNLSDARHSDHQQQLASWMTRHTGLDRTLNEFREDVMGRIACLHEQYVALERRERGSWERYCSERR